MRHAPIWALALAACADQGPQPVPASNLSHIASAGLANATWTTSRTGVEMIMIGQFNNLNTVLPDINDHGLAVGVASGGAPETFQEIALSWKDGVFTQLGTLGGARSRAHASNNAGTIVGEAHNVHGLFRPVVWQNGVIRALPRFSPTAIGEGAAIAINERGDVVGRDSDDFGQLHAVLWPVAGGARDLGMLPGTTVSYATGISSIGTVLGRSIVLSPLQFRTTIWNLGAGPTEIAMPEGGRLVGSDLAMGQMFNDAGNFLGEVASNPFAAGRAIVYRDGAFVTLPLLPTSYAETTIPRGLNEIGDVVGSAAGRSYLSPVVWGRYGALIDLGIPEGAFFFGEARGINNRGLIVGEAWGSWQEGVPNGSGTLLWRCRLVGDAGTCS